jgi:hypothetical protein
MMGSTDVVGCGVCATDLHLLDGSIALCFHCREARPFMCPNQVSVSAGFSEVNIVPASQPTSSSRVSGPTDT